MFQFSLKVRINPVRVKRSLYFKKLYVMFSVDRFNFVFSIYGYTNIYRFDSIQMFATGFALKIGKKECTLSPKFVEALQLYFWKGNIRELKM